MHGGISVYTKSLINIEKDINIILSLEDPYFKHEELENITPIIFKRRKLERFRSCVFPCGSRKDPCEAQAHHQ